ncbi:flagellar hook-basal body complex protein FliE [uncultured Sneathiella sp.]|uniref:flagellar hook-basal body complex protein FliE n=1 Tax=uncultured Sneathiella sp. TaxID=879315 RepID=UPI0030ED0045|tara:strand:- start:24714 stop:25043 length:330 start_codon:yes stop_codon:yes gene_type:complete
MADTSAIAATQAYSKAINNALGAKPDAASSDAATAVGGPSFAEMLAQAGTEAVDAGVASEQISLEAVTGNAGLADIVTAVSNAEATLETVVAVRDRVIQAYQDIIKMPI